MRKKHKEDEQTLKELNLADRRSQAECQLVQTNYIKRIKLFLILPHNLALINRNGGLCLRILTEVVSTDQGQESPIQTDLAQLIRCLLYGNTKNNLIRLM